MTFWFCHSCKRTWHSFVPTPDNVKKIRCFHCMADASFRIKDDSLPENVTYEDYDKDLRKFKIIKRNELKNMMAKNNNVATDSNLTDAPKVRQANGARGLKEKRNSKKNGG